MASRDFALAMLLVAGAALAAGAPSCGGDESGSPGTSSSSGSSSGGAAGGGSSSSSTSSGGGAGGGGSAQEVTVAVIGDSGYGSAFKANLQTMVGEQADLVLHVGDFDYNTDPDGFFAEVDGALGADYPYFTIVGNHDAPAWDGYATHMADHFAAAGVVTDDPDYSDEMYSSTFMGLRMVFVGQNGNNATFAQYILDQIADDEPGWRICAWHKNQQAMQVGGKGDSMGWAVYDNCRTKGALMVAGHEHSYERTKTLTSMESQTVDSTCSDPNSLCLGPGRSFAFVNGLGGAGIRDQNRCLPETYPYGCNGEWAFIYTSNQSAQYGTLFLVFNDGGDPKKARGYFKTIDGDVVDQFTITRD